MERAAGGSRKTPRALVTPAQPGAAQPGKNTSRALAGGSAVHAQGLPPARTQGGSSQSLAETLGEKPVVGGGQVKLQYRAGDAEPTAAALRVMDFPTTGLNRTQTFNLRPYNDPFKLILLRHPTPLSVLLKTGVSPGR